MVVTDSFVLINYPKTGSTFARAVLREIYALQLADRSLLRKITDGVHVTSKPFFEELMLPNIKVKHVKRPRDQHGCFCQIPDKYRDKKITTIIRNPYSRFMSAYTYKWWQKYPPLQAELLEKNFPNFPDLSLDEYVDLMQMAMIHGRLEGKNIEGVGDQTVQFIQMFFKQPESVLSSLSQAYINSEKPFDDIADIHFIQQENLNNQLAELLTEHGYAKKYSDYARSKERVNVTESSQDRAKMWTPKALNYIEKNEKLIFRIYERAGIHYSKPEL